MKSDGKRHDLLAECNAVGAPPNIFEDQCCNHCINPECSRSLFGQSKFDRRVDNWHDRLFAKVPRMEAEDSRFNSIAGQNFMLIDVSGPSQVSQQWAEVPVPESQEVRPVALPEKTPEPEPTPAPVEPVVSAPEPVEATPEPQPEPAPAPLPAQELTTVEKTPQWADLETSKPHQAPKSPPKPSRPAILANTPNQPGKVLKSSKDPWAAPEPDPWAAPIPASQTDTSGEVVVKPGAKVKLGS